MRHDVLEVAMLTCFSIGWYWSIGRMLRIRAAVGKSPIFVLFVCTGYLCGIGAKAEMWRQTGEFSPVIWLYCWNLAVTSFDLALVLYFSRKDQPRAELHPVPR